MKRNPDPLFAQNFRNIRENLFLSRPELGQFLGVTHQQIYKYENSISHIPVRHIHKIAQTFNIDYDRFFDASYEPLSEAELSSKILSIKDIVERRKILKSLQALVE